MKWNYILLAVIIIGTGCSHTNTYLQDDHGVIHGPYRFREGDVIDVKEGRLTVAFPTSSQLTFQKRIKEDILPPMDFRNAHVRDVVRELERIVPPVVKITLNLDRYTDPYSDSPGNSIPPLITMHIQNYTLMDATEIIADVCHLHYWITENRVEFKTKYIRNAQPIGAP